MVLRLFEGSNQGGTQILTDLPLLVGTEPVETGFESVAGLLVVKGATDRRVLGGLSKGLAEH